MAFESADSPGSPFAEGGTRERLLGAAEKLFSARGYAAVSVRDIAADAGANLSAIKYHFGSKEDLYLATVGRALSEPRILANWALLRREPAGPAEAAGMLVAFIRAMLSQLLTRNRPSHGTRLMLFEALHPSEATNHVIRDFITPNEQMLTRVIEVVASGQSDLDSVATARSILGQLIHYIVFRGFLERRDSSHYTGARVAELADHITRFSLRGLSCTESFIDGVLKAAPLPAAVPAAMQTRRGEDS